MPSLVSGVVDPSVGPLVDGSTVEDVVFVGNPVVCKVPPLSCVLLVAMPARVVFRVPPEALSSLVIWPLGMASKVFVTVALPLVPLDGEPMPGPVVVLLVKAAIATNAKIVNGTANNVPFSTFFFTSLS